tara:strand:- start:704 stop:2803 length:2100 start_codon:yes stop_codon:yes gene_type:complete
LDTTDRITKNRLSRETSPYLLQHQFNPVDWFPWGQEAFEKSQKDNKPILLSIGYSSCHWCHVMAHESFENTQIANLMNDHFINIKVDREERPDVDSVYMTFTQALTGQGGWPMTVFLTPELKPFYAGTYYPPNDSHGRPGFPKLLSAISKAWNNDQENILNSANNITLQMQKNVQKKLPASSIPLTSNSLSDRVEIFRNSYDETNGGFGNSPKFPSPTNLEFLLTHGSSQNNQHDFKSATSMVLTTLKKMWEGGIYDHLAGGFSRYSVDEKWLIPHFEKMLYDNAQLAKLYTHAYQITEDMFYKEIATETIEYILTDLYDENGTFFASQDADSEGVEGKFFVWTSEEFDKIFDSNESQIAKILYNVQKEGNFFDPHHPELTGRSVLSRKYESENLASKLELTVQELQTKLNKIKKTLLEERKKRIAPKIDDKILTSWNGLMLAALAEAGRVFGNQYYIEVAEKNVTFFRENMWKNNRFFHTYKDNRASVDGLLEDYTFFTIGLIELYKATGNNKHLQWAKKIFEQTINLFHDDENGAFFDTPKDGENFVLRQKSITDSPTPSGNGAAAIVAIHLSRYFNKNEWQTLAEEVINITFHDTQQVNYGVSTVLQSAEFLLAPRKEISITGRKNLRGNFERKLAEYFLPNVTIAVGDDNIYLPIENILESTDTTTAYVCSNFICQLPATSISEFTRQLDNLVNT